MAITLNTQPQGTTTYRFNESRLARIVQATSLEDAQRMGWFDRVFGGRSAKRAAIAQLYQSIHQPGSDQRKPADLVTRFQRLRDLALPEQRDQFRTEHQAPNADGYWSFSLAIGDAVLYNSPPDMCNGPDASYLEFQDALKGMPKGTERAEQMVQLVQKMSQAVTEGAQEKLRNHTLDLHVAGNLECAVDDLEERKEMGARLDDPVFCSSNFRGIETGDTSATFKANFEQPGGKRTQLVFSNREISNAEFRGQVLRDALAHQPFESLRDLMALGFGGPKDALVGAVVGDALVNHVLIPLQRLTGREWTPEQLIQDLLDLRQTHPAQAALICHQLGATPVGQTQVLDVLFGEQLQAEVKSAMADLMSQCVRTDGDPVDALRAAAALGDAVHPQVGPDPDGRLGADLVAPLFDAQVRSLDDQSLRQAFQAFLAQPVHARDAVVEELSGYVDLQQGLEDPVKVEALRQRAGPLFYGAGMLQCALDSLQRELERRGSMEPAWRDPVLVDQYRTALPKPPQLVHFVQHYLLEGHDMATAAQFARPTEAAQGLPDHAVRV